MFHQKIARLAFVVALVPLALMWLVHFINLISDGQLYQFGIFPRTMSGLIGVFAAPFIHSTSDFGHILNNSLPTLILTWLLFYNYRTIATRVFIIIFFLTGIATWLLARDAYHIGMSGVIYGLTSFLVFSGFFRKNMQVAAVSLFVIFLYGSLIWGVFPTTATVSWEGHAMGLFTGIIAAVLFKFSGPQPGKFRYELEEELGIEPDHDLWKQGTQPVYPPPMDVNDENKEEIVIHYDYKPKA